VLPFSNLSGDASQDYLGDVLTEELTTSLSRLPGSLVVSRTTAFSYRGEAMDVKQIGKESACAMCWKGARKRAGRVCVSTPSLLTRRRALTFGRISSTQSKPISSRCRTKSSLTSPGPYKSN
jgi:TolB-like protein